MKERRRHTRYPASGMTFAVGLERPGRLLDISAGGVGVRYPGGEQIPDEVCIDLLHTTKSVFIKDVRCRKVRDETTGQARGFSYVADRHLGLEFTAPTPEMIRLLEGFRGADN